MKSDKALLLLYVKHPKPGETKTRLAAGIGHEQALAVYRELLSHLKAEAQKVACDVAVFYGNEIPEQDLWAETGWPRILQQGEDLGQRMLQGFEWGKQRGYGRMVLVGSDIPDLNAAILRKAFQELTSNPLVIGPSEDGGYYLIGMKEPHALLFQDISWSTPAVYEQTLTQAHKAGLAFAAVDRLNDIDVVEDLQGTFLASYASSAS